MSLFVYVVMLVASHGARRAHLRRVIFVWDIDRASRGGLIRHGGDTSKNTVSLLVFPEIVMGESKETVFFDVSL